MALTQPQRDELALAEEAEGLGLGVEEYVEECLPDEGDSPPGPLTENEVQRLNLMMGALLRGAATVGDFRRMGVPDP